LWWCGSGGGEDGGVMVVVVVVVMAVVELVVEGWKHSERCRVKPAYLPGRITITFRCN
jgi:hypothetical protein